MIYIASDHGGFQLKEKLKKYLQNKGEKLVDLGPQRFSPKDDFPDYAIPLAEEVVKDPKNLGILLCRNGAGVEVAANKVAGARAVISWDPKHAASTRADDNANILALPADYLDEQKAIEVLKSWLATPFSKEERFERRLEKIEKEEENG